MSRATRVRCTVLVAVAASLACAPARDAAAQQAARPLVSLRVGDTLRVWARHPAEQVGALAAPVGDTLSIVRRDGRRYDFPVATLAHVDVQRGTRRSTGAIVAGALLGGAAGSVAGALLGVWADCGRSCDEEWEGFGGFFLGGVSGAVIGAITGGRIAVRYTARRWEQVFP